MNVRLIGVFVIIALMGGSCGDESSSSSQVDPQDKPPRNNPVIRDVFTADPAPMVHDGRFYIYVGHDEQQAGVDGFLMNEWLCFSSTDMVNWTNHGPIMRATDFAWSSGQAWASHMVEKDGKFYWYTTVEHATVTGKAIGVAVSDSPTGPFIDAIGEALITNDMTTHTDIGWDDIDPAVFIDDDGSVHLYWGNTVLKYAKLKDNMTELDGPIEVINLPAFTEGPWVFKRDGKYYLNYSAQFPEVIDYAMADSPAGPWTYTGRLNDLVPNSPTNHQGVVEYKGDWYFVYHNGNLSGGGEYRRSVCIDYLYFNEEGAMQEVQQTAAGVTEIIEITE